MKIIEISVYFESSEVFSLLVVLKVRWALCYKKLKSVIQAFIFCDQLRYESRMRIGAVNF